MQIIYLNGPSSSGKTTIARALQHALDDLYLHVSIDKIIGWMPAKVNNWTGEDAPLGYSWKKGVDASGVLIQELQRGPYVQKIARTFQNIALLLAKMGHHLIIDDVSFGSKQLEKWKELFKGFDVLWIGVNAPLSILEQREKERDNRIEGSARSQFHQVHMGAVYDLTIDTHHTSLADNVACINALVVKHKLSRTSIRVLQNADLPNIIRRYTFPWSTPERTKLLWDTYYQEQEQGVRTLAVIEENHEILGYGSLLRKSEYPLFMEKGIPEINAVWIDEGHRQRGLGTALIQWLEELAKKEGFVQVGIGVGLYKDYGPAQRLYFQLGYIPDGNGITYQRKSCTAGHAYPLDDDLILWLTKAL